MNTGRQNQMRNLRVWTQTKEVERETKKNKAEQPRVVRQQKQNPTAWLTGSGSKADATDPPVPLLIPHTAIDLTLLPQVLQGTHFF